MLDTDASLPAVDNTAASPALLRQRGSNHVGLRQFNERVVLQALRTHGSLAKAEMARVTGLTAQTIGLITARLDEDQLLRREAPVRGRVGQPSVPIGLNPDGAFAIGIKIGRRSADWLLVDFTGHVRERIVLDYAFPDIDVLLPAIRTHLNQLLDGLGPLRSRVVGVGVAAPFQLGGWHRMLGLTEAQSEAWNNIDLAEQVQQMTELPVSFAKDTSAACVAELLQGRGRDIPSFCTCSWTPLWAAGWSSIRTCIAVCMATRVRWPRCRCHPPSRARPPRSSSARLRCGSWSSAFANTDSTPWPPTTSVCCRPRGWNTAGAGSRALRRAWRTASSRPPRFWTWMPWWSMALRPPSCCRRCAKVPATRWPTTTGKACTSPPAGAGHHGLGRPCAGRSAAAAACVFCAGYRYLPQGLMVVLLKQ